MTKNRVKLRHVYKTYQNDRHILRDLNFEAHEDQIYFIQGQSGSGKTTLFKLLTAMLQPTSGEIVFNQWPVSQLNPGQISDYRKNIGIVFQDYKLIQDLTVFENICLPLKIQKKTNSEISKSVDMVLEKLDLKDFLNEYPEHISGGQQQKTALARALIGNPKLIIADEPTGNLDQQSSRVVIQVLEDYVRTGSMVLVATHDLGLINLQKHQVLHLNQGQINT
jgi:cell division transport system ATP-binding protein